MGDQSLIRIFYVNNESMGGVGFFTVAGIFVCIIVRSRRSKLST